MRDSYLTMIYVDGGCQVAHYRYEGGKPEIAGLEILRFLTDKFSKYLFLNGLAKTGSTIDDGLSDLFAGPGAKVLSSIQKLADVPSAGQEVLHMEDMAGNSHLCGWAYVLDLDNNSFEVFAGDNYKPLGKKDRFNDLPATAHNKHGKHQLRLVAQFPFSALPWPEDFTREVEDGVDWINEGENWF